MKKALTLLLIILYAGYINIYAQGDPIQKCGTVYPSEQELQQNPALRQSLEELEEFTKNYTENYSSMKQQTTTYVIPVVFHIIHTYSANFISDAQVYDALRIINEDFSKTNADITQVHSAFQPIAAESEVEFRIARLDPNGNCTSGITRTFSDLTATAGDNVKSLIMWPRSKYLNVWVVQTIASGAGGYAYYPSNTTGSIDGIVIRNAQFGSIGTSNSGGGSRSLSHEIGHYLNLKHTWGSTNDAGLASNCTDDDLVADTPLTIGNLSCNVNAISCGSLDNVQNYMDYSFCGKMFTEGQKIRMHAALNSSVGSRNNLHTPANLLATGTNDGFVPSPCVPIADFQTNSSLICEGSSVTFNDYSWRGDIDTYAWSFPGGTPSTSNLQNPTIQYNTAGVYPVTLTVSNAAGSDTKTITDLIIVRPASAGMWVPSIESFENMPVFPAGDYLVQNEGGNTWALTNSASYSGSNSVWINNSVNVAGKTDVFITPGYYLSNISNAIVKFKLAYAVKSSSSNDQLRVFASNSCGQFWTQRLSKSGTALSTWGLVSGNFVPTNTNQWREETVNLSSGLFSGNDNVSLKFEYTHDGGNNMFIDDINIDGLVGIEDATSVQSVNLFPNPASVATRIEFTLERDNHVTVKLVDMLGRDVKTVAEADLPAGVHYTEINDLDTPGVYFVKLIIGQDEVVNKLVVR